MKYPILVPNIFNHPFTYESSLKLKVGDYVMVPFGKSKITGVVWDEFEKNNNKNFKTKNVIKKLNQIHFLHLLSVLLLGDPQPTKKLDPQEEDEQ